MIKCIIRISLLFIAVSTFSQSLYTVEIKKADTKDTLWQYYFNTERIKEPVYTISVNEKTDDGGMILFGVKKPYYIQWNAEKEIIRDLLRKCRK
jgi:hypothetical protein